MNEPPRCRSKRFPLSKSTAMHTGKVEATYEQIED